MVAIGLFASCSIFLRFVIAHSKAIGQSEDVSFLFSSLNGSVGITAYPTLKSPIGGKDNALFPFLMKLFCYAVSQLYSAPPAVEPPAWSLSRAAMISSFFYFPQLGKKNPAFPAYTTMETLPLPYFSVMHFQDAFYERKLILVHQWKPDTSYKEDEIRRAGYQS